MVVTAEELKAVDSQSSFKDNRAPKCARCRNHGVVNSLKGHKHFCQWKNCTCSRCQVVVERQKITAERVAFLRFQRKMKSQKGFRSSDYVPSTNKYVDLGGMKYLDGINKRENVLDYTMSDTESERNSSGTPASISPPASPPSSVASNDMELKPTGSSKMNICSDPTCTECWTNSTYMVNTKLERLRSLFPMLTIRTLDDTLMRFKGNLHLATEHLFKSLQTSTEIDRRAPVCREPNCRECETVYKRSSPKPHEQEQFRRSPTPEEYLNSRKRQSPTPYDLPAKRRSPVDFSYSYSKASDIPRVSPPTVELYSPLTKSQNVRMETKSKIILPPTLLKKCIDCSSTISADDKFCGKCGHKQN